MALWGRVDSKVVPGTVAVVEYVYEVNELAARTVTGTSTTFLTADVADGSFVSTHTYTIKVVGTTDWNAIGGGSTPQVGDIFVATGVGGAGTGVATTGLKNGETILIDSVPYKIGEVVTDTSLILDKPYIGSTASGLTVTANESPVFADGKRPYLSQPFGVDNVEQSFGDGEILSVTVNANERGGDYAEDPVPTVTVGSGATFTVSVVAGDVMTVTVTDGGADYTLDSVFTIPLPRLTMLETGVDTDDILTFTTHLLADGEALQYNDGGGAALAGLTDGVGYFVSGIRDGADDFRLAASLAASVPVVLAGVTMVTDTAGSVDCTAAAISVGDRVQVAGTDTDSAFGSYSDGMVLKVASITTGVEGVSVTEFVLEDETDSAIVTAIGGTTGLAFTFATVIDLTGTGNDLQFFVKTDSDAAEASISLPAGDSDLESTAVSAPGWTLRTVGTGGRAGRVTYETLAVVRGMSGDAADDAVFPES